LILAGGRSGDANTGLSFICKAVVLQLTLHQNIEQGYLVNGSLGKVIEFMTIHDALARDIAIAEQANRPKRTLPPTFLSLPQQEVRPLTGQVFGRHEVWPLVRFETGRELLCAPLDFTIEGYMGNIEACRMQVPLILAWALSIHKSQGQTLTRVKVDLAHTFEKGQGMVFSLLPALYCAEALDLAYVAISRATSMEGLEIESFQPSK
jgi:ATP-dependent DNA helicase PIF1